MPPLRPFRCARCKTPGEKLTVTPARQSLDIGPKHKTHAYVICPTATCPNHRGYWSRHPEAVERSRAGGDAGVELTPDDFSTA